MALTTTSYAILSLLAVRPWTTYELKQQMDRSLRALWPRAGSVLYDEPKKLVAHGLAVSRVEYTGRRKSTVYEITDAGRQALRDWLDVPGAGPVLEFEGLLKVSFADHGDLDQLRANIARIKAEAEYRMDAVDERMAEYAETGGPYPERLPVIALGARFLREQNELLLRWAEWAEQETGHWTGTTLATGARVPPDAFTDPE
ncbi:PadR family transcriptional regulator [Nocardia stercoris]|uniref:PadR family transcriptional regulator n=1 Tax=Nocardia stercoris TaxID=2483361 RepID=A0A3M2LDK6_9NOCA|nr:PadR family transcriptional regulator [Nocardia stercoris]RMI35619.1 PadR family transcriptional regulator [Nocardia stercoris]